MNNIIKLMRKYEIRPSKRFGQNFLIDESIVEKIIIGADIKEKDVVEIGPGLGSLTNKLLLKAKSVTAYELDKNMQRVLEEEIDNKNFKLISEDFLKADLNWKNKRDVVANIPYNITTDIIFKLIKNSKIINSTTLMVQKEFGLRMIAKPKTKEYGKLSVSVQSIAEIEKVTLVKNTCFIPAPKVDSIVVKMTFKEKYNKEYFKFVLDCFAQKRKTLFNNLKNIMDKEKAQDILDHFEFKESIRPQEVSVEEFKQMFEYLK